MADARCSYSTASAYGEEGGTLPTARQRIRIVVAGIAVVCVGLLVASAGRRDQAALGSRELLLQARPAGAIGREVQEEKDDSLVAELKAKLAKVEKGWQKEGARALQRNKAAKGAANGASKSLQKGALRTVWLTTAQQKKMVAEKTRGSAPANTPGQMKQEKVENVLRDIDLSLAAQQEATNAALMLLESQSPQAIMEGAEIGHLDGVGVDTRAHGERGRTGLAESAEQQNENATGADCINYTVTNKTDCVPRECNTTDINLFWNASLPCCTVANSTSTTEVDKDADAAATPAPWNKHEKFESDAAGVAGDKSHYDTIYCFDDGADGSMHRHARTASYCWFHRAYCELYCVGDIMSTPPPSVQQHTPDSVAYGHKGPHLSWASWSKRLKNMSPYAVYGAAMVGEPKFNYGGINEIQPVKIPETTGGRNGGIFEKYYQDGR